MSPEDYAAPLDHDALGWICWLADSDLITLDQFIDLIGKALA